jgi:hypothetical protein
MKPEEGGLQGKRKHRSARAVPIIGDIRNH